MMSKTIRKSLGEEEEIKKYFSVCGRYIKLRVLSSMIKWLAIFAAIISFLILIDRAQMFTLPKIQSFETGNYMGEGFTGEAADFSFIENSIRSINLNSQILSNDIITIIKILVLIFIFIILPTIIAYNVWYIKISNEFVLTDRRLIVKRGWLNTNIKTIYYNRITDMNIGQTLLEKIIKIGTLSISTAGSDGYEVILWHIRDPYKIKKILYEAKFKYEKDNHNREEKDGMDEE